MPESALRDALVARVDFGGCTLLLEDDSLVEAGARGRLMGPRKALGNTIVVGDRVHVEREGERLLIEGVEPRRNAFSRRAAGDRATEQVVAANVDQIVLVAALVQPDFKAGLADRVFAQAEHAGIPARLVINKIDLGLPEDAQAILAAYARAGYGGHAVSAHTGEGVDAVRHACRGRRSLFVGHSGVGKSRLLNALVPELALLMGHVNAKTGRGRHTTTAAWLVRPERDLELIDTPGVRVFSLWGIEARNLEQSYPEFRPHLGGCRFADCGHVSEPGCGIRAALDAGQIAPLRYASFLKLREELQSEDPRGGQRATRGRR
jgi:ribosome biogenesis GTPase / thiamine phosphate phosphatase